MESRWWTRFALLGAAAAAMMVACALWGDRANPPLSLCRIKPAEFDGASLWNSGAVVTERGLEVGGIEFACTGLPPDLKPGDAIAFSGTFRAPATLEIARTRRLGTFAYLWVLYAVSVATLLAIGAVFVRHFRPAEPPI